MISDPYKDFADKYDLFSGGFGNHSDDYKEFFSSIFQKHNVERLLDCACGTGNDLYLFKSLGIDVIGSDISESMLDQAKKNFHSVGENIELHQLDFRHLDTHFKNKFDCVCCLSTSIWHLPNEDEVVKAYSSMKSVLTQNGILIISQGTSDKQWSEKPRFIIARDNKEITRLFVIDYPEKGMIFNVVDIIRDGEVSRVESWSMNYAQVLMQDDHQRLLSEAGFGTIEFFGSYNLDPYDKEKSNRLIAIAL